MSLTVISDPQLYVILQLSRLNRLPVFFEAIEKLGPDEMLDFVEVIPLFLSSTAPSIVGEADVYTMETIDRNDSFTGFLGGFFELSLRLISTPLESFALATLDEYWSEATVRQSLFDLAQAIANCSHRESLVKELVKNSLPCTMENSEFVSLVRVLSLILVAPLNIAAGARELTIFLLSSVVFFHERHTSMTIRC
jgi:hypothetical protein